MASQNKERSALLQWVTKGFSEELTPGLDLKNE